MNPCRSFMGGGSDSAETEAIPDDWMIVDF
jgi:hypothetical protein